MTYIEHMASHAGAQFDSQQSHFLATTRKFADLATPRLLLGVVDDVRTIRARKRWLNRILKEVHETLATEKGRERFDNIKKIREQFEPKVVAAELKRARRARAARQLRRWSTP